jgi:hypothetical protein
MQIFNINARTPYLDVLLIYAVFFMTVMGNCYEEREICETLMILMTIKVVVTVPYSSVSENSDDCHDKDSNGSGGGGGGVCGTLNGGYIILLTLRKGKYTETSIL